MRPRPGHSSRFDDPPMTLRGAAGGAAILVTLALAAGHWDRIGGAISGAAAAASVAAVCGAGLTAMLRYRGVQRSRRRAAGLAAAIAGGGLSLAVLMLPAASPG